MNHDIIVIGAGPAGMAAAVTAAEGGAKVLLLDDQPAPGGQIYRAIENADANTEQVLGADYMTGRKLTEAFHSQPVDYVSSATVWQVTEGREVGYSAGGKAKLVRAPWVIMATGAIERPFPIRGWTLPGVMMAGAAQTILKASNLAADGAVFAGSGPLLYLVVHQYLKAGVRVAALLDTTAKSNWKAAIPHLPGGLFRWDMLSKGRRWMKKIRQSDVLMVEGVTDLRVLGEDAATGIAYTTTNGQATELAATNIFLHQGVVPHVNLAMAAGVYHEWNENQLCWCPNTDHWGRTNVDNVVMAGDGAGIGGALAAEAAGCLAALGCLAELGRIDTAERDRRAQAPRVVLEREHKVRPFLDAWFKPAEHFRLPSNETIVCRCEELTAKDIRDVIDIGIAGPNQLKSYSRAGMGSCQGRFCGLTVQEIIAGETGCAPADVGYYRLRPPIKPIPLEELADMEADPPANED